MPSSEWDRVIPASVVALRQGALARMPVPGRPWGPHGDRSEGSIRSRPRPPYEEGWVQGLALLVPLA